MAYTESQDQSLGDPSSPQRQHHETDATLLGTLPPRATTGLVKDGPENEKGKRFKVKLAQATN